MGLLSKKQSLPDPLIHPDDIPLVQESDIEWYRSLSREDILAMEQVDNTHKTAGYLKFRDELGDASEAARAVWSYFPYYYHDPDKRGANPLGYTEDDSELPFVLKDTVNRLAASGKINPEYLRDFDTMNAAIRSLL